MNRRQLTAKKKRKVHLEPLEQRLLLDADLQTGGVAAVMSAGIELFGDTVDDFVENETLLDTQLPLVVRSGGDNLLEDFSIAPTIRELLSVDADIDGDGFISGSDETNLNDGTYDIDADNTLDFPELFQGKFISDLTGFLDSPTDHNNDGTIDSADLVSFLDAAERDLSAFFTSADYPDRSYNLQVLAPIDTSASNQVSFELDFSLTFTNELALDLGFTAEDQGIVPSTSLMVDASVFFTLEFGVLTSGEDSANSDFFIEAGDVTVGIEASRPLDDIDDMRIGFLGVDVEPGGSASLTANVIGAFDDPSSAEALGFDAIQFGSGQAGGIVDAASSLVDFDLDNDVSLYLRIGNSNTIEVNVPSGPNADLNALVAKINTAIANATEGDLSPLTVAEATPGNEISLAVRPISQDGITRLYPSELDPSSLGFNNEQLAADGVLVADSETVGLIGTQTTDPISFLVSVNHALPAPVTVTPTPQGDANDADPTDDTLTLDGLVADISAALLAAGFNISVDTVDVSGETRIRFTENTAQPLEITRTLTLESKITFSDLTTYGHTELMPEGNRSTSGYFEINLPIQVKPGLQQPDTTPFTPQATISLDTASNDPFDPALADQLETRDRDTRFNFDVELQNLTVDYDQEDILNFTNIDASSMIGLFREFGRYLDGLSDSEDFTAFGIPFAAADLGDVLDFADMWNDALLVDDNDTADESDDVYKLINENNEPEFTTAQELAAKLGEILHPGDTTAQQLAAIGATYNPATADLTYNINLASAFPQLEVPADFNLPIGPLDNVNSNSSVLLGGTGSLNMVLGVNLGEIPGEYLTETTTLDELEIDIKTDQAVTGESEVRTIYGRLGEDATFDVTIRGATYQVTVYATDQEALGFDDGQSATGTLTAARPVADVSPGVNITFDLTVDGETYVIHLPTAGVNGTDDNASGGDLAADLNAALANATAADGSLVDLTGEVLVSQDVQGRIVLTAGALTVLTLTSLGATSTNSSTNESTGLSDLADDIRLGLTNARLKNGEEISIREDLTDDIDDITVDVLGNRIRFSSTDAFTLTVADGDPAMNKLGFKAEHVAEDVDGTYSLTTTKNIPRLVGQLTTDARFTIEIDGQTYTVTVEAGEAEANKTILDLVNDVNRALKLPALVSNAVSGFLLTETASFSIAINGEATGTLVEIAPESTDGTAAPAAFNGETAVFTNTDTIEVGAHSFETGESVVYRSNGGTAIQVLIDVDTEDLIDGGTYYVFVVDDTTIKLALTESDAMAGKTIDLLSPGSNNDHQLVETPNTNIEDLVQDINRAIGQTSLDGLIEAETYTRQGDDFIRLKAVDDSVVQFELSVASGDPAETVLGLPQSHLSGNLEDRIEAESQGNRLVLTAVEPAITSFNVAADSGNELGLATAQVSNSDDLLLYLSNGSAPIPVDLDGAVDISDVIGRINAASADITVELNDTDQATGLKLTDGTWSETSPRIFHIEPINASNAAVQLGIVRADVTRDANKDGVIDNYDADGVIDGAPIKGPQLADRFFVENATLEADFELSTPAVNISDITIDSEDASKIISSELSVDHVGLYIDIYNSDGTTTSRYKIMNVEEVQDSDPTQFIATLNAEVLSTNGTGEFKGIQASGNFGFAGVDLVGEGTLPEEVALSGEVTTSLTQTERGIDAIENTQPTVTPAAGSSSFGQLVLDLVIEPTLSNMVAGAVDPADPRLELTVESMGDPFTEQAYPQAEMKGVDRIEIAGDQTDWFTKGTTITIDPDVDTSLPVQVSESNYDSSRGRTTFVLRTEALKGYLGHLSDDATFLLSVNGGSAIPVSISKDSTDDNDSVFDLATDVNNALAAADLDTQIEAKIKTDRLVLTAIDPAVSAFTLTASAGDPAVTELGFDPSQSAAVDDSTLVIAAERTWGLQLSSVTAPTPADIQVTTPGAGNLDALNDLLLFDEIDFQDVLDVLNELIPFIEEFEAIGELSDNLLLVDLSIGDLMGLSKRFSNAVEAAEANPAETLQQLESKLGEAFGFAAAGESVALTLDETGPTPVLRFDMLLAAELSEALNAVLADINLTELINGVDLEELGRQGERELTQAADGLGITDQSTFTLDGNQTDWIAGGEKVIFDSAGGQVESQITGVVYDSLLDITTVTIADEILPGGLSSLVVSDEFVDLKAAGVLEAAGDMILNLDFGIDLGDPDIDGDAGQAYLYETTAITGALSGGGEDLAFRAGMGPFNIEISGGSASLDVDFAADLVFAGRKPIEAVDLSAGSTDVQTSLDDQIHASFPATFNGADIGTFELSSNPGLTLPGGFISDLVDDYVGDDANLFDNILLAVDGVDLFLEGLQNLLDGEVFGFRLPLIGDQLADGARFIEDLRKDFVAPFRDAIETVDDAAQDFTDPDKNIVSGFLVDLLGPEGIDLLLSDAVAPSEVSDFISLDTNLGGPISETFIQWNMTLGSTLLNPTPDIGFELGIPGLNLKTEGNIELKIDWELTFGFGISFADGFYLDISDSSELELNLEVNLPAAITGTLGFLSLSAADKDVDGDGDSTGLAANFGINILTRDDLELLGHTDELPEGADINDFLDDRLSLTDLFGNVGLDVVLGARAAAELGMSLEVSDDLIGDAAAGFPRIIADFIFDWEVEELSLTQFISEAKRGETGLTDVIKEGLNTVAFKDVTLDLGSYISDVLGPVLDKIQDVTEPIQPVIDILTEPIPVISDLGPELTLLDIAAMAGRVDPRLLHAIADVVTLINSIPDPASAESLMLNFGDYVIFDKDAGLTGSELWSDEFDISGDTEALLNDPKSLFKKFDDFDNALDNLGGGKNSKSVLKKMKAAGDFAFPIFEDPAQIFGLLTGKPAVLITYDMDPLSFEFEWSQFFSVFGPLGVSINMEFSANIDFAFGYDTLGIQEFVEDDFRNPLLLLDGFYVSDTDLATGDYGTDVPELTFYGGLWAAAELNLLIARAGVGGGIYAQIEFDLFDPDQDGRVRIKEILGNVANEWNYGIKPLAPLAIFDVYGEMWARLFAFLKIDLFIFSYSYEFDITPPVTLLEFDIPFTRPPQLATETGGNLQINAGEFAEERLNYNTTDGAEYMSVRQGSSLNKVIVSGYGFSQEYELGGSTIYWSGGEGNDVIDFSGVWAPNINFVIDGGPGNDTIILGPATAGSAIIRGGEGNDTIYGGGGADEIYGGLGSDIIDARGGDDVVIGDTGWKRDQSLRVISGASDGNDIILGGSGHDILIGGGGKDDIDGQAGDDIVVGDGVQIAFDVDAQLNRVGAAFDEEDVPNRDFVTAVNDTVRDFFFAGDKLRGGGNADEIYGGKGDDSIYGDGGGDFIFGEIGFDLIRGGDEAAGDGDKIFGDGWRITESRVGGRIADPAHLKPTSGGEADEIHGDGGDDIIYSGGGPDLVGGGAGNDTIYGGSSPDVLFGDAGHDFIYGQGDPDLIYGGSGGDTIDGGAGLDVIYGDNGADDYQRTPLVDPAVVGSTITVNNADIENFGRLIHRLVEITAAGADPLAVRIVAVEKSDTTTQLTLDATELSADMSFALLLSSAAPAGGLVGDDRITAGFESDIIDGQWGSDTYTVNLRGAGLESLVDVFDTGVSATATDRLTVNGTDFNDEFLVRASADPDGLAFVALIKTAQTEEQEKLVERVNFQGLERLTVNGLYGDDYFAVDDTHTETTLNGGVGEDFFQVGQLYRSRRAGTDGAEAGIGPEDYFATLETTRGWLSNGISKPMTIRAGAGNDEVVIFHNLATLAVFGDDGNDRFLVKAFALEGSTDAERGRVDLTGGAGADNIQYAVNAPVNIDGGDGLDTIVIIGTEFSDDFVITKDGVYGAGLNVNFKNVEFLTVDGAEGDDRFFVRSTDASVVTEIAGGLGSDTFFMSGDTPPVVSNDLLGHSGIITHSVESVDTDYDGLAVAGISANVADDDEPAIVIRQSNGATILTERGFEEMDFYEVVLSRQPTSNVYVKALAPSRTPEEEAAEAFYFRLYSDAGGAYNELDGTATTLLFTPSNWNEPQMIYLTVPNNDAYDPDNPESLPDYEDEAIEGPRTGIINHIVVSPDTTYGGKPETVDGTSFQDTDQSGVFPDDGSLIGSVVEIIKGPGTGQSRYVVAVDSATGTLTVDKEWAAGDPPDATSEYIIRRYDNLQLPSVEVRLEDNEAAGVIVYAESGGDYYQLQKAEPTVIEAAEVGDRFRVRLTRQPEALVTVNLTPVDSLGLIGVAVSSEGVTNNPDGSLSLVFGSEDWNYPKTVWVAAVDDTVREGFHYGAITFSVESADTDRSAAVYDETFVIASDDPATSVILAHRPLTDPLDPPDPEQLPLTVEVDGERRDADRYSLESSTIAFIDEDGLPEEVSGTVTVTYSYLVPGYDGVFVPHVNALIGDNDTPGVLVTQSNGSTDVIEGNAVASWISDDTYTVVLTSQPEQDVIIDVSAIGTKTTRGPIVPVAYPFAEQVAVSVPGTEGFDLAGTLVFTPENWNVHQHVRVEAVDDDWVDGGDTKVFAPVPHTVSDIQGPLVVSGFGGVGSLVAVDPLMLPGETNVKEATGDVVDISADTLTVNTADVLAVEGIDTLDDLVSGPDESLVTTVEITEGPNAGEFRRIIAYEENTADGTAVLQLNKPWSVPADDLGGITKYAITDESRNFFVEESEQVDYLFVFNEDSLADSVGVLTDSRIIGLGMGIDATIGGQQYNGGITYTDMEALEINLGYGNDTFDVQSIHRRDDYRTVTVVNTGENSAGGNDRVTVTLDREAGGLFALNTQGGDDIVDAGGSTLPLVIFGGDGNDVIIGGSGGDLLFGDSGRVDYRDSLGTIVTRLGAGSGDFIGTVDSVDGLTLNLSIEAESSASDEFPTAYGGLEGLELWVSATGENDKVVSETRTITANDAGTVTVSEAFTIDIDASSRFRITGIPENQTDGAFRDPSQLITWDFDTGGDDVVIGMGDRDIITGGGGSDTLLAPRFQPPIDLLQGADGMADFVAATTTLFENRDASIIDDFVLGDVILGDQGLVVFTDPLESDAADSAPYPLIEQVETIEPQSFGNDRIFAGNGPDLVMGGGGDDNIDAGAHIPIVYGIRKVISINFNADVESGAVMGAAGAVHAGNWNNLAAGGWAYGDDSGETIHFQDGTAADGVVVQVAGSLDSAFPTGVGADSHDQIVNPGTENECLFEGSLYTSGYATLGVNVSGLSEHFGIYDVYVYLDADNAHSLSANSVRSVSDGTTTFYLNDADGNTFTGEFVLADAVDTADAGSGNYVVFRNLTADVAAIRIDDVGGDPASNFPSIAGIQIVEVPEDDTLQIAADTDKDKVTGDSGLARMSEGVIHELVATGLETFDGDDTIRTGDNTDLVIGGFGDDSIYGEAGHDLLIGDKARLLLLEDRVRNLDLRAFSHIEVDPYGIEGIQLMADNSGGDDVLAGGMGDDLLYGQFGDDTYEFSGSHLGRDHLVEAGDDDDAGRFNDLHDLLDFSGFVERVVVDLRREDLQAIKPLMQTDTVHLHLLLDVPSGFEDVNGSEFADIIIGNARDNTLSGLGGNDLIYALDGEDLVYGGDDHDIVPDSAGNDEIHGEAGDDYVRGRDGDDRIYGGPGADRLEGGSGDDMIVGGEGDDYIVTGEGNDQIVWNEGDGDDTVVNAGTAAAAASIHLPSTHVTGTNLSMLEEDAADAAGAEQGGTGTGTQAVLTASAVAVEQTPISSGAEVDALSSSGTPTEMVLFGDAASVGAVDSGDPQPPTPYDALEEDLSQTDDAVLSAQLANESKSSWMYAFLLNSARDDKEDPNSGIKITLEEEDNSKERLA